VKLLSVPGAAHFCGSFSPESGGAEGPLSSFCNGYLKRGLKLAEGTAEFGRLRACLLRDAERRLFLSASHYRRALGLLIPSSSPWALVTLYYGSWHAANALLALFGSAVIRPLVIDVDRDSPAKQRLRVKEIGPKPWQEPCTYSGSHQQFWDIFYRSVSTLRPYVNGPESAALSPVSSDPVWQTRTRNEVNYDSHTSIQLALDFQRAFAQDSFPQSLPGLVKTQHRILADLLEIVYSFAAKFQLRTDALEGLGSPGEFRDKLQQLIVDCALPQILDTASPRCFP
jgi:hypothetical protein